MMFDSWDGQIWYPRFYDMDTICSYDNSGAIKFDVDIEMQQGYWNTSSSRLWTKVRDLLHDELVSTYNDMRKNGLSYEGLMKYFYEEQIAQIPQKYYNMDADVKYLPFGDTYLGKAHGDGYEHLKRWLKNRLIFTDTLFDYAPSYESDMLTFRANTLDTIALEIETYTPVYQHISFYNGQMSKIKVDGKKATVFTGNTQTSTDQEILVYGGSNIKRIKGISSMNPNSMLIGGATKLAELDISNCPILTDINSNKANFSPHEYLNKLNIENCPNLGGALRLNNSPLIQEIKAKGTNITSLQLPTSIKNLETLELPNTITSLELNEASVLDTLKFDKGVKMQSISLSDCPGITTTENFDLKETPTITLDNSYDIEELYMSKTNNLTLKNMNNLKRLIYLPNNEYDTFTLSNVTGANDYIINTFNCPKLTTFMTTAPQRLSYNNGEYGDITPNTVFTANTLDLSNTQFTDIKLLCTTDVYNLKVPTTMKNFYCDSAMDIDTDVIEDANYEVIHEELIEPYTTNYEGEVYRYEDVVSDLRTYPSLIVGSQLDSDWNIASHSSWSRTDYIQTNKEVKIISSVAKDSSNLRVQFYDKDKVKVTGQINNYGTICTFTPPNNTVYVITSFRHDIYRAEPLEIVITENRVPNIIPSSANGSLIFNMYSNNTTQPTSTSPYMWDLTGLKLNDFHTYGMNNWVKTDWKGYNPTPLPFASYVHPQGSVGEKIEFIDGMDPNDKLPNYSMHCLQVKPGETYVLNKNIDGYYYYAEYWGTTLDGTLTFIKTSVYNNTVVTVPDNTDLFWIVFNYHINREYVNKEWNYIIGNGKYWWANPSTDYTLHWNDIQTMTYEQVRDTLAIDPATVGNTFGDGTIPTPNITMPQRMPGYSVRLVNADITPNEYPTMLYPKWIDTGLPITGKLDYTKYNGTSLAWAYAYTTGDVDISPLDSRSIGQIEFDYNKLYGTDFVDVVDVWVYKDTDTSSLSTNETITKAYIELTSSNYTTRVAEVLAHYPNCKDLYFFEDGSVTDLSSMMDVSNGSNDHIFQQIETITFMEGYFDNLAFLNRAFRHCHNLTKVTNIPNTVRTMNYTFEFAYKLQDFNIPTSLTRVYQLLAGNTAFNKELDFSNCPIGDNLLEYGLTNAKALTIPPKLPSNYKGSIKGCFEGCTALITAPTIPSGVTNMVNTFRGCSSLTTVPNIPPSVTDLTYTFYNCSSLEDTDTSNWDTSNVRSMSQAFLGTKALPILKKIDLSSVTTMNNIFEGFTGQEAIIPNINAPLVTNIGGLFHLARSVKRIDISNWTTGTLTHAGNGMFYLNNNLEYLNMTGLDFSQVTDMSGMFDYDTKLVDFYPPNNISCNFSISHSPLSVDSIVRILNNLATVESATLNLGSNNLAKITEEQIGIATAKGWTVQ